MTHGVFSILLTPPASADDHAQRQGGFPLPEFIGGEENALALAAEKTLFSPPELTGQPTNPDGSAANNFQPIVLYGPTGVGKSALALGLAERWRRQRPAGKIIVITGADFARAAAFAFQTDTLEDFRAKYRTSSLFVLEDLDELANKETAQDELAGVLDAGAERQANIVVTLRCNPRNAHFLSDRLISRLGAGLSVPLAPPGADARRVILEHLFAARGVALPADVAELLAGQLAATAVELNAVAIRLENSTEQSTGRQTAISMEAAQEFLDRQSLLRTPTLAAISKLVSRRFSLKPTELKSATRKQAVVRARGVAMLLARELTSISLQQIGRHFGGRDHTTVLHACRKTTELLELDPQTQQVYTDLRQQLYPDVALGPESSQA